MADTYATGGTTTAMSPANTTATTTAQRPPLTAETKTSSPNSQQQQTNPLVLKDVSDLEAQFGTEVYDEVEIEDMDYDEEKRAYFYPCPCGDRFVITREMIEDGDDIATCPSCSLRIKIIYDADAYRGDSDSSSSDSSGSSSSEEEENSV